MPTTRKAVRGVIAAIAVYCYYHLDIFRALVARRLQGSHDPAYSNNVPISRLLESASLFMAIGR